jgi:hypothetical protein
MAMDDEFEDDDEIELFEDYEDGEIGYARFLRAHGVDRECRRCGAAFRGMPDHGYCNACADTIEAGFPVD